MAAVAEHSAAAEERIFRRPKKPPISASDPNPQIPSIIQSSRCKFTVSSFFLSTFSNNNNMNVNSNINNNGSNVSSLKHKGKNFTSATLRGLGCATSSQVSAPAVIRSSADCQAKKVRKKKQRNPHRQKTHQGMTTTETTTAANQTSAVVAPDVCYPPGIAFVADASSVDCVVSGRPVAGRGRVDGDRVNNRERSCTARRTANLEHMSALDSPSAFEARRFGSDVFEARHYRHFRHRSPGGLTEIMMFQSNLLLGGRSDQHDQYRDWRLDVDNMSYEELLELGERIGYVSTGLREDEIFHCLRKTKHSVMDDMASHFPTEMDWKCSICQEEYEANDEVGKLDCGHSYHLCCIKQWLLRKNACPVCKAVAVVQY